MSKYGNIASLDEALNKVGHLDSNIITQLISLALRVRNDDIQIDWALEKFSKGDDLDLTFIEERLLHTSEVAAGYSKNLSELKVSLLKQQWV